MAISSDVVELVVAVVAGVLGKFGYDKGRSIMSNGKAGYLTRESHDRECGLKLQPIAVTLARIEDHVEKLAARSK